MSQDRYLAFRADFINRGKVGVGFMNGVVVISKNSVLDAKEGEPFHFIENDISGNPKAFVIMPEGYPENLPQADPGMIALCDNRGAVKTYDSFEDARTDILWHLPVATATINLAGYVDASVEDTHQDQLDFAKDMLQELDFATLREILEIAKNGCCNNILKLSRSACVLDSEKQQVREIIEECGSTPKP